MVLCRPAAASECVAQRTARLRGDLHQHPPLLRRYVTALPFGGLGPSGKVCGALIFTLLASNAASGRRLALSAGKLPKHPTMPGQHARLAGDAQRTRFVPRTLAV